MGCICTIQILHNISERKGSDQNDRLQIMFGEGLRAAYFNEAAFVNKACSGSAPGLRSRGQRITGQGLVRVS